MATIDNEITNIFDLVTKFGAIHQGTISSQYSELLVWMIKTRDGDACSPYTLDAQEWMSEGRGLLRTACRRKEVNRIGLQIIVGMLTNKVNEWRGAIASNKSSPMSYLNSSASISNLSKLQLKKMQLLLFLRNAPTK